MGVTDIPTDADHKPPVPPPSRLVNEWGGPTEPPEAFERRFRSRILEEKLFLTLLVFVICCSFLIFGMVNQQTFSTIMTWTFSAYVTGNVVGGIGNGLTADGQPTPATKFMMRRLSKGRNDETPRA